MEQLLSDRLKDLWRSVDQNQLSAEDFGTKQEHGLDEYRSTWKQALLLPGHEDLQESLLSELGKYFACDDLGEIRRRCNDAVTATKREWERTVDPKHAESIEQFYDHTQSYLYDLMWWHSLCDDDSPLACVTALHFAQRHGCRKCLDFGAGVGSGAILFAFNEIETSLADVNAALLRFSEWRFGIRSLGVRESGGQFLNLRISRLPKGAFDIVTAMDVFEHLVDPVKIVNELSEALRPGGFLFGRFHAEIDEDRPQHIVQDFGPVFARLSDLGFVQVWQDEWLWGHQVFQKT